MLYRIVLNSVVVICDLVLIAQIIVIPARVIMPLHSVQHVPGVQDKRVLCNRIVKVLCFQVTAAMRAVVVGIGTQE